MKHLANPVIVVILIYSGFLACKKSSSPNSGQNPPPDTSGCRLSGVTYRDYQVSDSQSWILNYNDKGQLVQVYNNPGALTTHINYSADGKLSTIISSNSPYIDTIIYAGNDISGAITLAADHTPLDTTVFSENSDGWITDIRIDVRLNQNSPPVYGHVTYNYENGQLQSVSESVENLQATHHTFVFLPNNLQVQDPKNPFFSTSGETLFLFYKFFTRDALGSGWTAGNIEELNYTDPSIIIDEEQYDYQLDNNKNVIHRDVLMASDAPGFSNFKKISDNNYTYDCK
jgi:hypothetical protein